MELLKLEKEENVLFCQKYFPTHEDFLKTFLQLLYKMDHNGEKILIGKFMGI
jgi:hypothetical protein